MSKQNRFFEEVAAGLEDGIAWARGEKELRVTERETSALPISPSAVTLPSLDSIYTPLHLAYDRKTDTLQIRLSDTPVEESCETEPGVVRDFDINGNLVALTVADFTARLGK